MKKIALLLALVLAMPAHPAPRLTFPSTGSSGTSDSADVADFRFTGTNVSRAKAILARAVYSSRGGMGATPVWNPGSIYTAYFFLRDLYMASAALPGHFTAAALSPGLERFFATVGGDPIDATQAAQHFIIATETPQYREGANNVGLRPTYDTAAYMILTTGQVYRRGDKTVYATHKAALKAMFESTPRAASGLLYSNPGEANCGWGFESGNYVYGELGMASALYAQAAREMVYMATDQGDTAYAATFKTHYTTLVTALRTLRRADGLYKAGSLADVRHAMLSGLLVAEDLIPDPQERAETAQALRNGVLQGQVVNPGGAVRHLFVGDYFPGAGNPPDSTQNGGWWQGQWTGWVARAMIVAGDPKLGQKIIQDAVDKLNAIYDVGGGAPWEIQNADGTAHWYNSLNSMAAGGFLEAATDQKPVGSYKLITQTGSDVPLAPRGFTVDAGGVFGLSEETYTGYSGQVVLRDPDGYTVTLLNTSAPVIVEDTPALNVTSDSTTAWEAYSALGIRTSRLVVGATAADGASALSTGDLKLGPTGGRLTLGAAGTLNFFDGAVNHNLLAGGSGSPGGSPGELQWNSAGAFGGLPNVRWGSTYGNLLVGPGSTEAPNVDLMVTSNDTTNFWTGRIVAGGASSNPFGVAFLMGQIQAGPTDYRAWLGAHNSALNAWADLWINPDGPATLHLGGPAPGLLTLDNNSGTSTFTGTLVVPDASFTVAKLSATGTPDGTTFLRGDGVWATPPGGAGAASFVAVDVDFGAGDTTASATVTGQTWVTSTSRISCTPTLHATSSRGEGEEDALIEGLTAAIHTRVNAVGFTLTVAAPNDTSGVYTFTCIGG